MSDSVRELTPFLLTLKSLKPSQRRAVLNCCNRKHLKGFSEVALNCVKNTTNLSPAELKTCQRWRKPLKLLALKRYPMKEKKQILLQKGGFLAAIIPVLASVISSAVASVPKE